MKDSDDDANEGQGLQLSHGYDIEKDHDVTEIQGRKSCGHDVMVAWFREVGAVGGELDCTLATIERLFCLQPDDWHPFILDMDSHEQIVGLEVHSAAWNART
jgi:hypothetical protein